MGDYLDVGGSSAQGEMLRNAATIACEYPFVLEQYKVLNSSLGNRSFQLSSRIAGIKTRSIVKTQSPILDNRQFAKPDLGNQADQQTDRAVYIVISAAKDGRVTTSLERKIPIVTIQGLSLTNLRDDFVAINVNPCEEGDPILTCVFKTEMLCVLLTLTGGNLSVNIGPS